MTRKKNYSLALALCAAAVPQNASSQQSLPGIDIGSAPLRSAPRRAPPAPVARQSAPAPTAAAPPAPVAAAQPAPQISTIPAAAHTLDAKELAAARQFDVGAALERVRRFPTRFGIHEPLAPCDSFIESAMEAEHGAGLQPGFA